MRSTLLLFAASALLCGACTTTQQVDNPVAGGMLPDAPLLDTRWSLRQLGGTPVQMPEGVAAPNLLLRATTQVAEGNAGCNRMRGSYTRTGDDQLTFSQMTSTKMYCQAAPTETQYLTALSSTTRYQIQGDTLKLFGTEAAPLARFVVQ